MKKPLLTAGFASFLMLAACNANDANDFAGGPNDRDGNMINVNDRYDRDRYDMYNENNGNNGDGIIGRNGGNDRTNRNELMTNDRKDDFGYVRHEKGTVRGQSVSYRNMNTLDRERTADTIGKLSLSLPKVDDVSVLVTDQEVLMAYDTTAKSDRDRKEAAEQVKRTALSVVPRWYEVYVTDDGDLRRDIENIAQTNGGIATARDSIGRTIKLMKQNSPQGYKEPAKGKGMNKTNGMNGMNGTNDTTGTMQNTGTPETTGTPGTNWTTGPTDQHGAPHK